MSRSRARTTVKIRVARLSHGADLPLPAYLTSGSAGMDLRAALRVSLTLAPGKRTSVPTGLAVAIPAGFEGQVRARSGLALKHGLAVVNAPGTVDSDYRGEVRVLLVNLGEEPVRIARGDRIAQLVIAPVVRAQLVEAVKLPRSSRGGGGFGHTGR